MSYQDYKNYQSIGSNFKAHTDALKERMDQRNNIVYCGIACYVGFVVVILALPIIFSGFAIEIANNAANSTCFQHANILTLSNYVLISSWVSIFIISCAIVAIVGFACCSSSNGPNAAALCALIPIFFVSLLYGVYSLVMGIIGAIELARSYPVCNEEANTLCIFAIIIVVLHFLALCGGYGGVKYSRSDNN